MFIAVAIVAALISGCGKRTDPDEGGSNAEAYGEPERYSATVVRIVEDGTTRETSTSRDARAGEQRREEWTTLNGQKRALIWRPDIGKAFLLDLDGRSYVEIDTAAARPTESRDGPANLLDVPSARNRVDARVKDDTIQAIDQYFVDRQPPASVETRALPQEVIDGHPCAVFEQRSNFPDGHTETYRRFRARDLSGLLLKVESETQPGAAKVITERRDVRTEVAPDMFVVPTDFKRVEKLPR